MRGANLSFSFFVKHELINNLDSDCISVVQQGNNEVDPNTEFPPEGLK